MHVDCPVLMRRQHAVKAYKPLKIRKRPSFIERLGGDSDIVGRDDVQIKTKSVPTRPQQNKFLHDSEMFHFDRVPTLSYVTAISIMTACT